MRGRLPRPDLLNSYDLCLPSPLLEHICWPETLLADLPQGLQPSEGIVGVKKAMRTRQQEVVFVCQVFYPDLTPTSQVFTDLLQTMAARGLQVRVLCGFPGRMEDSPAALGRHEQWQGMHISRCGWQLSFKQSYFHRFAAYASFLFHVGWQLLGLRRKRLVVGVTNPPFLSMVLYLASKIRGFHYHYIFHDLYPEGLVALGRLPTTSLIVKCWMWLNRLSYHRASVLFVLGRDMASLLQRNYGLAAETLLHVPNWSPIEVTCPQPFNDNPLAAELNLTGKFVVQYSGNMGLWHDLETFVRAAALLQNHHSIHFLFIGDGIRRHAAEQLSRHLALTNVTWLDFVSKEALPESLACAHVALISLRSGLVGIAVPSKLYGILASGRPVIAQVPAQSEVACVVAEEQCGIVVEPGNAEQLTRAICTLAADAVLTAEMGTRAFQAYQAKYTVTQAVQAFERHWHAPDQE